MALSDIQPLNRLIFQHGNTQISPQHLKQLNGKNATPFIPMGQHQPHLVQNSQRPGNHLQYRVL